MSLTLNIAEHELVSCGNVVRVQQDNLEFNEVRLYLPKEEVRIGDVLYLCGGDREAAALAEAGARFVYVNPAAERADERSVLSVFGGESMLTVFGILLDAVYRYTNWEREMDRVCFSGGDLQDLLDVSSAFLRNNVVIVDPALKLLAYTKDIPCDDPITMELIAHGYHTEANIRKFKLHKRFDPWAEGDGFVVNDSYEICKYVTIVKSFKTHSSFSLIIIMMCNVAEPEGYLYDAYSLFAQRVQHFAERDYPDDKPSGNAADTFLKDLFSGELQDKRIIEERCKHVGVPYSSRFCMFYLETSNDKALRPRLLSDVSRLVAPAKTVLIEDAIVVLCFNCTSDRCALHCESGTCPHGLMSLSARLDEMLERFDLVCGRSSKFIELAYAPIAFEQAREAHRFMKAALASRENLTGGTGKAADAGESEDLAATRRLSDGASGGLSDAGHRPPGASGSLPAAPRNWGRICSFDACYIDYLVRRGGDEGPDLAGHTYAGYVLDAIARNDAESHMDNYEFLYAYLLHERRTSVVSGKLHMHRNNVKYRIDRIEKQYGIDTEDPQLRLDFLIAYRIREALAPGA